MDRPSIRQTINKETLTLNDKLEHKRLNKTSTEHSIQKAKNTRASAEDIRYAYSIPGSGRSPVRGHGNPLQYSCLENPTDRGA